VNQSDVSDAEIIRRFCGSLKVIVLLDGLDEIAPDLRDRVCSVFLPNSGNSYKKLQGCSFPADPTAFPGLL